MDNADREEHYRSILSGQLPGAELVIGLVGSVGADLGSLVPRISSCLERYDYTTVVIRLSELISHVVEVPDLAGASEYTRIDTMMTLGNEARETSKDNAILAMVASAQIYGGRTDSSPRPRHAFVINSLKHPDEVNLLRRIYGNGFFLVGVYVDPKQRHTNLLKTKDMKDSEARALMQRDEAEGVPCGQRTRDTFHLSDFFIHLDRTARQSLTRFFDVVFADPYRTPLFDEYAMFMAFAAATRSADLSRQIGAVIARDNEVLATGVNECPCAGGGAYWPHVTPSGEVLDTPRGRDYRRKCDSNDAEKAELVNSLVRAVEGVCAACGQEGRAASEKAIREAIGRSPIDDITEYGRVVHAEMNALMTCARNGINCKGATLYSTTFPCHNCAKHIIAAGITRVVYIEPYPKSRALKFHDDAAFPGFQRDQKKGGLVAFEPFVGIGPRRFFDLFSMRQGSGFPLTRKNKDTGATVPWNRKAGTIRIPMLPSSYLQREALVVTILKTHLKGDPDGQQPGGAGKKASSKPKGNAGGRAKGGQ
ncbi:MAG: cytidine deaminase [Candidatus Hydrogenedentes bacterium]|nr:cytidine deaminase [Candidatus Hydrogenedentota bacterium]